MDYKKKTILLIAILALVFISIGFLINFNGSGLTGSIVANSIACYENADCDDGIDCTGDLCRNPGTEQSICINQVLEGCE